MHFSTNFSLFILAIVVKVCNSNYTNEWALEIKRGPEEAAQIAEELGFQYVRQIMPDFHLVKHHRVSKRSSEKNEFHHTKLSDHPQVVWLEQQKAKERTKRDFFIDPKWSSQWYLNRGKGSDMNVMAAYERFGVTGEGVVVTIMDDGIEKDHPDLIDNYDPKASFDYNDNDDDPQPRYDFTNFNRHGTRCAGEVSAAANNTICGVGIAYKSRIGGIRMLDGDVTDAIEANSLTFNNDHIDIYSASWGPTDDGKTLDGPGKLASMALERGVEKGRKGRGSIFVWASGNGGRDVDNCNCDGYTNNMYTLSISSVGESNESPFYSERCSSTMAATYSSGNGNDRQITTTDLHKLCTENHSGTSASAPLAAGVIALALQINPELTWRDMQHLVVMTSHKANLKSDDWKTNGVGRLVSHRFGYGLLDAEKLVETARGWKNVPTQNKCIYQVSFEPREVPHNGDVEIYLDVDGCNGTNNEINYLEHVQAYITMSSSDRGQVELFLTSPNGTISELVRKRPLDHAQTGFQDWPFMSVHHWGEQPQGKWKLKASCVDCNGTLTNWTLALFGTKTNPIINYEHSRVLRSTEKMCDRDEYFLDDSCYKRCPKFHYPVQGLLDITTDQDNSTERVEAMMCMPCHISCEYCTGPSRHNCTSCLTKFYLTPDRQCFEQNRSILYLNVYTLSALFAAATITSIIISVTIAKVLGIRHNRKSLNGFEQYAPLLDESP